MGINYVIFYLSGDDMQKDEITAIPKTMENFFGCSGNMLKPCAATVKALLKKVPKGKLATTELIRTKLASDFKVQTTCPAATDKALQAIANDDKKTAYWRVVKKKGELIAKLPGGVKNQAALLEKEGFTIDSKGKTPKVLNFEEKLYRFD